jgi:hypothetical protein
MKGDDHECPKRNRAQNHYPWSGSAEDEAINLANKGGSMAASPNVASQVKPVLEEKILRASDPQPVALKQRVRDLLVEIFEGYIEFLGWTPN